MRPSPFLNHSLDFSLYFFIKTSVGRTSPQDYVRGVRLWGLWQPEGTRAMAPKTLAMPNGLSPYFLRRCSEIAAMLVNLSPDRIMFVQKQSTEARAVPMRAPHDVDNHCCRCRRLTTMVVVDPPIIMGNFQDSNQGNKRPAQEEIGTKPKEQNRR